MSNIEYCLKNISLLGGSSSNQTSKKKDSIELVLIGLGIIIILFIIIKLFFNSDTHTSHSSSQVQSFNSKELICKSGQGDSSNIIRTTSDNILENCENECRDEKECKSFDYTQDKEDTACRLFSNTDYESNPGVNNRLHCTI